MGKLLVAVVVLLLVLLAVDVGARVYTQDRLEQTIDGDVAGAQAGVTISGFPFLAKLLADGQVDKITAHLAQAGEGAFVLNQVTIAVTGVTIDRGWYVRHRQLKIDSIDSGTVTAEMSQANFDNLVDLPVVLGQGVARATVAGVSIGAQVSIVDNHLVASGLPFSIPIPALPVLPCTANVQIVPGNLIASCTFDRVPSALQIITP